MGKPWQRISRERGIALNNQYFMVRCGSREKMYEFKEKMKKEYGFEFIDATASTPLGTSMFFNLTTKLMFYCNLALNNLSGPYIGNKAIDMDDFITIVEIYRK